MNWYFNNDGSADGPHDEEAMAGLVSSGRVTAQTLVWQPEMKVWQEVSRIAASWSQAAPAAQTPGRMKPKPIVIPDQAAVPASPPTESRRAPIPSAPTGSLLGPAEPKPGFFRRLFGRKS